MRVIKLARNLECYDNSLWHGGKVAIIECDNGTYNIYVNGIVSCNLIAKKALTDEYGNNYCKGEIIETVKDKNNDGEFFKILNSYITDDEHLDKILDGKDSNYELEMLDSNWIELEFINNKGEMEYDDLILDFCNITDAIDNVVEEISKESDKRFNYVIYCRSASYNGFSFDACDVQKECCLDYLKRVKNIEEDKVGIFIDDGFSGINYNRPCFKAMLDKIKKGNVKQIITPSFSRICRDLETSYIFINLLKEHDVDLYSIKENLSLKDIILPSFNKYLNDKTNDETELEYE